MHLLCHAFRKDTNDVDRPGMILEHLPFYYQKYFRKAFSTKLFGVETPKEVLDLIRDTVITSGKNQIIEPLLPDEMESLGIFHMLTEECRLDRVRRIDTGDESAKLKIQQTGVAGIQTLVNTVRPAVTAVAGTPAAAAAGVRPIAQVRPMGAAAAAWPRPAASV